MCWVGVCSWLIRWVLDWMIGFIAPYTFAQFGTTGKYSAIAIPHTLQFTVAHALGFSVFTSRNLATDFSQSHCHFKSHMESSLNSLIPFFPLFCSCQFPKTRLSSIPSSYHGRLAFRNPNLHSRLLYSATSLFKSSYVRTDGFVGQSVLA
jgi:hypothetical protein